MIVVNLNLDFFTFNLNLYDCSIKCQECYGAMNSLFYFHIKLWEILAFSRISVIFFLLYPV